MGKTRLALEVAAEALPDYPDGVWLVSLASLSDPALVAHAVAAAVGVPEHGRRPPLETLSGALRMQRALLVLDNCEHLVQACAELTEVLLGACPDLRILTTSREPLGLAGELTWRVPSLSLPTPPPPPPDQLSQYAAVRLFVERATAARPDFQVTNANAPAVAQVCWRLDGIPLAIELAAAWVRTLSVEELAARLGDRLDLLVGGSRTAPPRQQTLRGAIEWSYGLLTESERRLFARLSVFAGGWTLEAAESVCAGDGLASSEILGLLRQLIDKSLVVVDEQADRARYRLLETLRAYARERARVAGELVALERRHLEWCLGLAEASPWIQFDPRHVARLAREQDNMRAALRSCINAHDAAGGLRLASALWQLWYVRGLYSEGRAWSAELLALNAGQHPTPARAHLQTLAGQLAYCQGDFQAAASLHNDSLAMARLLADDSEIALALLCLGNVARGQGDTARAKQRYLESLAIYRRVGDPICTAILLSNLATVAEDEGDPGVASAAAAEALDLFRTHGHVWGMARSLAGLAVVAASRGERAAMDTYLAEALRLAQELNDRQGLVLMLLRLARAEDARGDRARAVTLAGRALTIAREAGDRLGFARAMEQLAALAAADQPERGVSLAAAAASLRQTLGADLPPAERERLTGWQVTARRTLGETAYAAAMEQGGSQTLEQAFTLAQDLAQAAGAGLVTVSGPRGTASPNTWDLRL